jgi:invasion protein IalB
MIRNLTPQSAKIALVVFLPFASLPLYAHAETLAEHGVWQAIKELENRKPVCVMSAEPSTSEGNYTQRDTVLAIISHRVHEKRIGEVGIQIGYTFAAKSEAIAIIDGKTEFRLFTQGGHAWAYDTDADKALIAAMKAGTQMVVKGTSSRGTQTTDTFSLSGFTATLNAINKGCGVK